ncbi:MAG: hypothetical protein C0599_01225 [Salinivirgaceae bacterium]|nr:MAG: hypothetical protein C0599_01225 [Salinivirgaceae bacterium]
MNIYPNPANESIKLDFEAKEANVKLFNVSGDVVFSKDNVSQKVDIKVSDFEQGLYFLIIENKKFFATDQLIIE